MNDTLPKEPVPYPGDEAFAGFLAEHQCPKPLHLVKFRFWGAITSTVPRVSPTEEISRLWNGEVPEPTGKEEMEVFFATMLSLWNELARMNMAGKRLPLTPRHGLTDQQGLSEMIALRMDELNDGFFESFVGNMKSLDHQGERTRRNVSRLMGLLDTYEDLQDALSQEEIPFDDARKHFVRTDRSAQKRLDAVVKSANAERGV